MSRSREQLRCLRLSWCCTACNSAVSKDWCHSIRGDTGYLPSETRFKAIHGSLGRRRPRQLLLHCSTSCIPAVVSAHGLREQVPHIPANGGGFDQQESTKLSGDMGGVRPETLRDRKSRMSPHGRVHGASQRAGTPCRRVSFSTFHKGSTFLSLTWNYVPA